MSRIKLRFAHLKDRCDQIFQGTVAEEVAAEGGHGGDQSHLHSFIETVETIALGQLSESGQDRFPYLIFAFNLLLLSFFLLLLLLILVPDLCLHARSEIFKWVEEHLRDYTTRCTCKSIDKYLVKFFQLILSHSHFLINLLQISII